MTNDQCAGDELVWNEAEEAKDCGGWRERTDTQRVEKFVTNPIASWRSVGAPPVSADFGLLRTAVSQRNASSAPLAASAASSIATRVTA